MAKKITTALLAAFLLSSVAFLIIKKTKNTNTEDVKTENTAKTNSIKPEVIVYYFHGTKRCYTCNKIEALTEKSVKDGFSELLKNKKIVIESINLDKHEYKHFIAEYELASKTVVVSYQKDGKEANWKTLDKVWQYVGDEEKFLKYIQDEIKSLIKEGRDV